MALGLQYLDPFERLGYSIQRNCELWIVDF